MSKERSGWSLAPDLIASARRLSVALAKFAGELEAVMNSDCWPLPTGIDESARVIAPEIIEERKARWSEYVFLQVQFDGRVPQKNVFAAERQLSVSELSRWFSTRGRAIQPDSNPDKCIRRALEGVSADLRRKIGCQSDWQK
jgi:hypothetical protein